MNLRGREEHGRSWKGQREGDSDVVSTTLMYKILKNTNKMNVKMCDMQDILETEEGES